MRIPNFYLYFLKLETGCCKTPESESVTNERSLYAISKPTIHSCNDLPFTYLARNFTIVVVASGVHVGWKREAKPLEIVWNVAL